MKPLFAIVLIAACAFPVRAASQSAPEKAGPACPGPAEVGPQQLLGLWRAEFEGLGQGATLLLERHPEFAQSLAGTINRNGERARLAGDIEDGEFSLEESTDGRSISATWAGDVVEGSCGREIRGTWKGGWDAAGRPFVLRRP
jgi:hypothetical protein